MNNNYLSTIDKPFGLLDRATQLALFEAWLDGKVIDSYNPANGWHQHSRTNGGVPTWDIALVYRVKYEPPIPDSINWDHVAPRFKYMTRNADGITCLWERPPEINGRVWVLSYHPQYKVSHSSYKRGTTDWRESLVVRPHTR